jgi:hypothetical protein
VDGLLIAASQRRRHYRERADADARQGLVECRPERAVVDQHDLVVVPSVLGDLLRDLIERTRRGVDRERRAAA